MMLQVKVTDLRANLPDFLKKVSHGEQIQITSHGKTIARIIPETNSVQAAQYRLDELRGTMIVGNIAGSRYFCESLFWASQPKQAAKT